MVLSNDHSKSGKHGHAKSRIGCQSLFTGKKKSITMTADTSVEVPEINKRSGMITDIDPEKKIIHLMDNETYETFEVEYPLDEDDTVNLEKLEKLVENPDMMAESQCEFWDVLQKKFCTRVMLP